MTPSVRGEGIPMNFTGREIRVALLESLWPPGYNWCVSGATGTLWGNDGDWLLENDTVYDVDNLCTIDWAGRTPSPDTVTIHDRVIRTSRRNVYAASLPVGEVVSAILSPNRVLSVIVPVKDHEVFEALMKKRGWRIR